MELDTTVSGEPVSWLAQDEIDGLIFDTESTPPPVGLPSQPPPDGHPISTDASAWQRLWRDGDIITEADGDNPGMPRRGRRKRMARVTSDFAAACPRRVTWRADDPHRPTHP